MFPAPFYFAPPSFATSRSMSEFRLFQLLQKLREPACRSHDWPCDNSKIHRDIHWGTLHRILGSTLLSDSETDNSKGRGESRSDFWFKTVILIWYLWQSNLKAEQNTKYWWNSEGFMFLHHFGFCSRFQLLLSLMTPPCWTGVASRVGFGLQPMAFWPKMRSSIFASTLKRECHWLNHDRHDKMIIRWVTPALCAAYWTLPLIPQNLSKI